MATKARRCEGTVEFFSFAGKPGDISVFLFRFAGKVPKKAVCRAKFYKTFEKSWSITRNLTKNCAPPGGRYLFGANDTSSVVESDLR